MGSSIISPVLQFFDINGDPLPGGQLLTKEVGGGADKITYSDALLTTPNSNPVVLNQRGECSAFAANGSLFWLQLKDATNVVIWTRDNVSVGFAASSSEVGAVLWPRTTAEVSASVTPTNYGYPPGDVKRYGASTSGTAVANAAAFQKAINAAQINNGVVHFSESGPWSSAKVTVSAPCSFLGPAVINVVGSNVTAYQWCEFTASFDGFRATDMTVVGDNVEANSHYGFGPTSSAIVVSNAVFDNCRVRNVIVGIDCSAMNGARINGGKIGPTNGNASGRGYGVLFGRLSYNCRSIGVHYYRCSRHSLYMGHTFGGISSGDVFDEHGYGATPGLYSALVAARGQNNSIIGPQFRNCVHNTCEIDDSNSETGIVSAMSLIGGSSFGCARPMVVGDSSATVDANANTTSVSIVGHVFDMPVTATECIRVYQADGLNISSNQFRFASDTVAQTAVTIDDVATNYPTNISITANSVKVNTSSGTKALVYLDTGVCNSSSTAAIDIKGNSLFGGASDFVAAAALQNANVKTDTKLEVAITGATPYVSGLSRVYITQGGATNVTNFNGGHNGQIISIRFGDGNSTVKVTNIFLAGGVDFVGTNQDQLRLEYDGLNWHELSRSVN